MYFVNFIYFLNGCAQVNGVKKSSKDEASAAKH